MTESINESNQDSHNKNPLHGITLEMMLNSLVEAIGWEKMGQEIEIRCFTQDPSIGSSLKFLRRTPWARTKVEKLYRQVILKERTGSRKRRS